ncbi:MAG: FumA C-terminus/TtdB family hydratase beta subunit [Promethearchaeia archaeon]
MEYNLSLPIEKKDLSPLKVGDIIYLTGKVVTARDQVHKRIIEYKNQGKKLPESFYSLKGCAIYHCGPIIEEKQGHYRIVSGGPTTSQRMDELENEVIKQLDIRFIIGKGGMRNLKTKELQVAYLSYTGGCGAIINQKIEKIKHVEWKDLGLCEAVWFLKVRNFGPLIVAQDTHGKSLY